MRAGAFGDVVDLSGLLGGWFGDRMKRKFEMMSVRQITTNHSNKWSAKPGMVIWLP